MMHESNRFESTRCNTLQHTATRCNIRQHTATYCNILCNNARLWQIWPFTLQHTATRCNTLHLPATCCTTMHQAVWRCKTLTNLNWTQQHLWGLIRNSETCNAAPGENGFGSVLRCVVPCCSVLQCVAASWHISFSEASQTAILL